ncbi:MAG TPA: nitroreductase family protein [Jiangellaceae bacterium]
MNASVYRLGAEGERPLSAAAPDSPTIVRALRYGITAPSAHNTQPWRVEVVSDTEARVYFDPTRLLPVTDPPGRQVHISHGTLLEMTAIAATHLGHRAEIELLPEGEMTLAEYGTKPTARLRLVADSAVSEDPLFAHVLARRSSRLPHTKQPITDDERVAIAAAASRPEVEPRWISSSRMPEAIDIAIEGMAIEVNTHDTWEETNQWFRFTDAEIVAKGDGLNAHTSGVTGLSLFALRTMTRPGNWHRRFNRVGYLGPFAKVVRSTQGLFTLVTPTNTMADWITTGRSYVRAQLTAASRGLRFHPISQTLQEFPQMDRARARMDALVDVTPPAKLQMLVRVGHTQPPALSPRRDLQHIVQP